MNTVGSIMVALAAAIFAGLQFREASRQASLAAVPILERRARPDVRLSANSGAISDLAGVAEGAIGRGSALRLEGATAVSPL